MLDCAEVQVAGEEHVRPVFNISARTIIPHGDRHVAPLPEQRSADGMFHVL
jgi:hypothetical protein